MKTKIKSPNQCTLNELNLFESLVLDGGEVQAQGLSSRIKLAQKLIFIYSYDRCVAIGSVKNPLESYKTKLFKNVGYENLQHFYNYEFGWLYVPISKRGNGISLYTSLFNENQVNCNPLICNKSIVTRIGFCDSISS